mmetsp:Transcript_15241/g.20122  ORF Transcript_15241/g.20122 Transcript_15241/m.20122 type:complete len:428 (+) Transcript_15241:38-1321(+)
MGKGGQGITQASGENIGLKHRGSNKAASGGNKNEILIDGKWYDISNFSKKHPGGRVITYYAGQNASEAYHEFHSRSKSADKYLKSIPSRPAEQESSDALVRDFNELRDQLEKEGFFKPSIPHVMMRLTEIVAMHALGFWMILAQGWVFAGLVVLGIVQGRCGWLMHEGGHYSLTGNITIDRALQVFLYGTGCGMSGAWWRNQHNKHHATPQKLGHDVDLDTLPLLMFNSEVQNGKQKALVSPGWLKLQAWCFVPITCLMVALGWQLYLHPRHAFRTKRFDELACMGLRYAVLAYLCTIFPVGTTLGCYLFYVWMGGTYIFLNFAVSHTHLPVVPEDDKEVDWVRYAAFHTMNVDQSWWCDWWMSFLNFQIEHHLFPSMPQFRHPKVSPRVRAIFEKHGVTYISMSYWKAMRVTFSNLDKVGRDVFLG